METLFFNEYDKTMKTNIYVQQTWASPKFLQAKNENMKEHPKNVLVTLSLGEGMTCMNVLNNEETSMLYTLLSVVDFDNIIHFGITYNVLDDILFIPINSGLGLSPWFQLLHFTTNSITITIFVNLRLFQHFETVTNIKT
jgi:hypothetical protein